jgi:hypothetical protein
VSFDDQIRAALDGATASLRDHLEAQLRAFAQEAARVATEEREQAARAAADERQQALEHAARVATEEREKALEEAARVAADERQRTADEADRAAAEERQRAVEQRQQAVKAASEAVAAEVRAQAEVLVADVRSQAETQVAQIRAAAQKHAEELKRAAETQIGELRKALEDLRTQAQQQLDAARRIAQAEIEKAHAEIDKARAETEKAHADADKARAEAESARAEADLARAETEATRATATQEIARAQAEIDTNRKAAAGEAEEVLIARLAAAHTVSERKVTEAIDRAYTDSHQSELSRAARLADAIRSLDEGRGLSEVLERLVQCSGHEVDRAAVLLVKGERLRGWRLAGFAPGAPSAKSIDLGVEEAGLAGAVLKNGVSASRPSDATEGPGLPPFAVNAGDRHAMALPVRVGGEVVAVLYADAPLVNEPSSDARWPAILDVLVRHASRVLEAMTVEQAAGLSLSRPMARGSHAAVPGPVERAGNGDEDAARRYARLLLSEIRMYYEPLVDAGRRSGDLMSRLHGEIARARQLYEARVPASVEARADYFDQELVHTLAGGDRTLLGSAP